MQSLSVTCAAALVITGICFLANNLLITRLRQKNTYKSDKLISLCNNISIYVCIYGDEYSDFDYDINSRLNTKRPVPLRAGFHILQIKSPVNNSRFLILELLLKFNYRWLYQGFSIFIQHLTVALKAIY